MNTAPPMPETKKLTKKDIRRHMKEALAAKEDVELHDASVLACERLTSLDEFRRASFVMLYMPLPCEVDVIPVALRCFQHRMTVCVPKVDWQRKDMYPVEISSLDDQILNLDEHGIRVPRDSTPVLPELIDVVVVPGLAFDQDCHRLGRGGGYYDRFLARIRPTSTRIGLIFDEQLIEEVPVTEQDVAVDMVVTDRRTIASK